MKFIFKVLTLGVFIISLFVGCVKQDPGIITKFFNFPNPFNPQAGSTTLRTSYSDASDVNWTLRIYNENGDLVYERTGTDATGSFDLTWAGRDNLGNPVQNGVYKAIMILDVTDDGSGNTGSTYQDFCKVVVL